VVTGGVASAASNFTINPVATISSLNPSATLAGGSGFTLTVNGANFTSTATVNWGTTALATTYVSAAKLTASVTSTMIATPGTAGVTVTTGGVNSAASTFTITQPQPTIASLSPNPVVKGSGAFQLTVYGAWFTSAAKVNWNGTPLSTSYSSATQLTAAVPATDIAAVGTAQITVTTTAGTSAASSLSIVSGPSFSTPQTLPYGFVNTSYNAVVSVINGGPAYTWSINGSPASSGVPVALGSTGLSVEEYGWNALTVSGNPASGTASPVTFTATATDPNTGLSTGSVQFSVVIYNQGYTVNGNLNFLNNCGNSAILPEIPVTINTTPPQTVNAVNGQFSFQVPPGTYTVTPSIPTGTSAPVSAVFTPASQSVTVNGGNTGANAYFQAALGYTVTGTVGYTGTQTGQIYVELSNINGCGNTTYGTSIAATSSTTYPASFTIRGVPPGSYSLTAWMDNVGQGARNASNPIGSLSGISVGTSSVDSTDVVSRGLEVPGKALTPTGAGSNAVTIADPSAVVIGSAPQLQGASPFNQGAVVFYKALTSASNSNIELPVTYLLQWSSSETFPAVSASNSQSFPAEGTGGTNIWIVNWLTNSSKYYFRAQGLAKNGAVNANNWSSVLGPVTVGERAGANTISGKVTFTQKAKGPLYVGFYDQSQNSTGVYVAQVGSAAAPPTSPASFSVNVPNGSDYFFFGILDQNNDGTVDVGDVTNTNSNSNSSVTISGSATENLTMPSGNSSASMTTQYSYQAASSDQTASSSYDLNFKVTGVVKLPVTVTLLSGPNIVAPVDLGPCVDCGNRKFQSSVFLGSTTPKTTDVYSFQIGYSDGTSDGAVTTQPTAVLTSTALATNLAPSGTGQSTTPSFSWTDPANAGAYTYDFRLWPQYSGDIWEIPSNNSNSNGFSSSVTSLQWGVDPTDSSNTPSQSPLSGGTYFWRIEAGDANGNTAATQASFSTGPVALSLSQSQPSSLPSTAIVGENYNGAINAGGGSGGYTFTVNGSQITTDGNQNVIGNGDGLYAINTGGNTLSIGGTPQTTTRAPIALAVSVNDGAGDPTASASYTITVSNPAALALPASGSASALAGYAFSESVNASGGVGPYTFSVNGSTVPTSGSTGLPLSDNLVATSTGGNTLTISGTPSFATSTPIAIDVSVTDSTNTTVGPVDYTVAVAGAPSGARNSYLNGRYVCLVNGFSDNDSASWASLASFQTVGSAGTLSGIFDENGSDQSQAMSGGLSGSFSINTDNSGIVTLTSAPSGSDNTGNTTSWALAIDSSASPAPQFRMIEIDSDPSSKGAQHGSGNCYLANPTSFATSTATQNSFAMGMNGASGNNNSSSGTPTPKAAVGRFTLSGTGTSSSGTISNGYIEMAKGGNTTVEPTAFTGTYTSPDSTSGKMTFAINTGNGSVTMAVYGIDANRAFILDVSDGDGLLAGNVRFQHQTTYTGANLNGAFVLYQQGVEYNSSSSSSSSSSASGTSSMILQGTVATATASTAPSACTSGTTCITVNQSYKDDNGTYKVGDENGGPTSVTFDSTNPGRVTFTPKNGTAYLYLFNNNNAFEMDVDGKGGFDSGWVEPQTSTTFSVSSLASGTNSYMMGQMPRMSVDSNANVGDIALDASGNIAGATSEAGEGDFSFDQAFTGTYAVDTSAPGTGTFLVGTGNNGASCAMITAYSVTGGGKFVCMPNGDSSPSIMIFVINQ
jgi:hypothetical protein